MVRRHSRQIAVVTENASASRLRTGRPRRPWLKVALVLLLLYVAGIFALQQYRLYQINQKIAGVKSEIAAAQQTKAALETTVENLQSDEYVEMVAREKLGLVKPGEIQYHPVPAGGAGN